MTDTFQVGDHVRLLVPDVGGVSPGAEGVVREVGDSLVWVYFQDRARPDTMDWWYPYNVHEDCRYTVEKYLEKLSDTGLWDELELM